MCYLATVKIWHLILSDTLYRIMENSLPFLLKVVTFICRGVGTGPTDPTAAGPMFEPILMIQLKALPAIFVKFSSLTPLSSK
jgi:hypothetical protein